jgi:bacillithiol synthase
MESACIRLTDLPGTSKLFTDFNYHFDKLARFYPHNPADPAAFSAAAKEIRYPEDRRAAMAAALKSQNGESALLDRFRKPDTVAVVTGQQVGLFSGPAYTIYKALTAAKVAAQLEARGIPAVPIFWLATEDHDFAEIAHAWVFDESRKPFAVGVNPPKDLDGRQRPVGPAVLEAPPVHELRGLVKGFPQADSVVAAVEQAYRPGVSMGEAFRALLKTLLGKIGILTLDPLDSAVRRIGAPLLAEAVRIAPELKSAVAQRSQALIDAGYHAQVHLDEKTSLFFLLEEGERVTLRLKDAQYAELQDRAADISPNALLRPVWQDYMLPTVAYVGGPAEIAYFAQSRPLYGRLLGRMPVVMPRTGFTLLDTRAAKLLRKYRLGFTDVLVCEETLKERIAATLVPESLSAAVSTCAADVDSSLNRLSAEAATFDPTLCAALTKSQSKIRYQVEKIRRKIARESLRRDAQAAADAEYLHGSLYPHEDLQERLYTILPFLAQHGMDLVDKLYQAVEPGCPDHRLVTL